MKFIFTLVLLSVSVNGWGSRFKEAWDRWKKNLADKRIRKCQKSRNGCLACPKSHVCKTDGCCYGLAHKELYSGKLETHDENCSGWMTSSKKYQYNSFWGTENLEERCDIEPAQSQDIQDELEEEIGQDNMSVCNDQYSCVHSSCGRNHGCPDGLSKKGQVKSDCWWGRYKNVCCESTKPEPAAIKTTGGTAQEGSTCVFPFMYKGNTYCECTNTNHGTQEWCYTKGDASEWGNCVVAQNFFLTQVHSNGQECGSESMIYTQSIKNYRGSGQCVSTHSDLWEKYTCKSNGEMIITQHTNYGCKKDDQLAEVEITSGTCVDWDGYSVQYLFDCKTGEKQPAPSLSGMVVGHDTEWKKDVTGTECPGTGGTIYQAMSKTVSFLSGACMVTGTGQTSAKYECSTIFLFRGGRSGTEPFGKRALSMIQYSDSECTTQKGRPTAHFEGCRIYDRGNMGTVTLVGCGEVQKEEEAVSKLTEQNKQLKKALLELEMN